MIIKTKNKTTLHRSSLFSYSVSVNQTLNCVYVQFCNFMIVSSHHSSFAYKILILYSIQRCVAGYNIDVHRDTIMFLFNIIRLCL